MKRLGLSNNALSGVIPSELGQLQGAAVYLRSNYYSNESFAPLSLCMKHIVTKFDLDDNVALCPPERNALNDFFDEAKGAEWTDGSQWLDEYGLCDWYGVTCDDNTKHVTKLKLTTNGLSGKLSTSIGTLTYLKELDLSNNDMKVGYTCHHLPIIFFLAISS